MAANKTLETAADVTAFIGTVADEGQRADAHAICAIMSRASGHPPRMWGASIIGFGSYHYTYDSGREGDMCRIGFSPRKGKTVLYMASKFPRHPEIMARLGKVKTGKSCIYVKRLSDLNLDVLGELCAASLAHRAQIYPQND